jgi:hypothetical protein
MKKPSEAVQRERIRLLLLAGQARIAHYGYAAESTVANSDAGPGITCPGATLSPWK